MIDSPVSSALQVKVERRGLACVLTIDRESQHNTMTDAVMAEMLAALRDAEAMPGVRVNAVAPGWIASAGLDTYDEHYRGVLRGLRHKVPLQRFGTEAELASAVVWLLSEAAGFVSGAVIRVDGGVPTARHTWTLPPAARTAPYQGFPQYTPLTIFDDEAPST